MSGIYIHGMELPKSCPCELIGIGYDLCCSFAGGIPARVKEYYECCQNDTRPSWCPLVPVPDHGRLIDADALWVEINKICDRRDAGIITDLTCLQQILSAVRHSPTIIEAEEAKEWEAIEEYEDEYWDDGCPIED